METRNNPKTLQDAANKFRRYAANVERDIEGLIFELLDLLDTKTKTLRKLLKLHLHIRKASSISFPCKSDKKAVYYTRSENVSVTSFAKMMTVSRDSMNEVSEIDKCSVSMVSEDIEKRIAEVGERLAEIKILENRMDDDNKMDEVQKCKSVTSMAKRIVQDLVDSSLVENSTNSDEKDKTINDSDERKLNENNSDPIYSTKEISPNYENLFGTANSSVLNNLEVVLSNLENCKLTKSGIFLDHSTYKTVLKALKATITKYDLDNTGSEKSHRHKHRISSARSRTPPSYSNFEEMRLQKLFSFSSECVKQKRKGC